MRIQSRRETEDFFHDIIAYTLPHIDKSNIRPAYQKTKKPIPAGGNFISQDGKGNGLVPFTNEDNFVYFWVDMNDPSNNDESEVSEDNKVTYIRNIRLIVYCYGEDSSNNALRVKSLVRSIKVQHLLNFNGYYQLNDGSITSMFEDINGEWWERNDLEMHFTCRVDFRHDPEDEPVIALGDSPKVIVDGGERL